MKNLILVGGLQYSGKSSFCKKIEESDKTKYTHFELDSAQHTLLSHSDVLLDLIKRHFQDIHSVIEKLWEQYKSPGKDKMDVFVDYAHSTDQFNEFSNFMNRCVTLYTGECVNKSGSEIVLLDGLLTNRSTRKIVYSLFKDSLNKDGNKIDMDSMKKLFVYFNLGLETSLERFRAKPSELKRALSEDKIKQAYRDQELPASEEFQNLEVLMINTPAAVNPAIEYVSRYNFISN